MGNRLELLALQEAPLQVETLSDLFTPSAAQRVFIEKHRGALREILLEREETSHFI